MHTLVQTYSYKVQQFRSWCCIAASDLTPAPKTCPQFWCVEDPVELNLKGYLTDSITCAQMSILPVAFVVDTAANPAKQANIG